MGKEIVCQVQESQSLTHNKPQEKDVETHTNQANRYQTQILKAQGIKHKV